MNHLRQAQTALAHAHVLVEEALADASGAPFHARLHSASFLSVPGLACAAPCRCIRVIPHPTWRAKCVGNCATVFPASPWRDPFSPVGAPFRNPTHTAVHLRAPVHVTPTGLPATSLAMQSMPMGKPRPRIISGSPARGPSRRGRLSRRGRHSNHGWNRHFRRALTFLHRVQTARPGCAHRSTASSSNQPGSQCLRRIGQ